MPSPLLHNSLLRQLLRGLRTTADEWLLRPLLPLLLWHRLPSLKLWRQEPLLLHLLQRLLRLLLMVDHVHDLLQIRSIHNLLAVGSKDLNTLRQLSTVCPRHLNTVWSKLNRLWQTAGKTATNHLKAGRKPTTTPRRRRSSSSFGAVKLLTTDRTGESSSSRIFVAWLRLNNAILNDDWRACASTASTTASTASTTASTAGAAGGGAGLRLLEELRDLLRRNMDLTATLRQLVDRLLHRIRNLLLGRHPLITTCASIPDL